MTKEEWRLAIEEAKADPEHMRMVEHVLANAAEYGLPPDDEVETHILAAMLSLEKKGLAVRTGRKLGGDGHWRPLFTAIP